MAYVFEGSQLQKVLKDMGQADLQVLASEMVPAVAADLESALPAQYQAISQVIMAAMEPALLQVVQNLVAKVQL